MTEDEKFDLIISKGSLFNELNEFSNSIEKYSLFDEDDKILYIIVSKLNSDSRFIKKLLPNMFLRGKKQVTVDNLKPLFNSRVEIFELYSDMKLEIIRSQNEKFINGLNLRYNAELFEFVNEKTNLLESAIRDTNSKFVFTMIAQYKHLDDFSENKRLLKLYKQSLKNQEQLYFSFTRNIIRQFASIFENGYYSYSKLKMEQDKIDEQELFQLYEIVEKTTETIGVLNDKILKMTNKLNTKYD